MEEFQRPSGRKDTQRTVDESTIIKKILEESEKAELERQRKLFCFLCLYLEKIRW